MNGLHVNGLHVNGLHVNGLHVNGLHDDNVAARARTAARTSPMAAGRGGPWNEDAAAPSWRRTAAM